MTTEQTPLLTLKDLQAYAKRDLNIGDEMDAEARDLPRKKAQWSEWISVLAIAAWKADIELKKITKERYEFYYINYNVKLDAKQIREVYLPGDDAVIEAQKKYNLAAEKIAFAERTLKSLIGAGFDIKNVIEYRKFMSGIL